MSLSSVPRVSFSPPGPDEKARKISRIISASAAQSGVSGVLLRPQELAVQVVPVQAVQTMVQPSTPDHSPPTTPRQSPTDEVGLVLFHASHDCA